MGKKKKKNRSTSYAGTQKSAGREPNNRLQTLPDISHELKRAVTFHRSGEIEKAEAGYRTILGIDPKHPDALHLMGIIASQKGDYESAFRLISQAIQQFPGSEIYYNNMGNALARLNRIDEAINAYMEALRINPDSVDAINNLATNLKESGRADEALGYFKRALAINPNSAEVYNNMGNALTDLGQVEAAIDCFQKAIALKPDYAIAYNNMGTALKIRERYKEAIDSYSRSVSANPEYAEAFNNLGETLADMGKPDEAIPFFKKAIELKPQLGLATGNLLYALTRICAWDQFADLPERLDQHTHQSIDAGIRPPEDPFFNLARHDDPVENFTVAKSWSIDISRRMSKIKTNFVFGDRKNTHEKITLGYLSSNFRNHALGHLIAGLFERHDRSRFNIYAYSIGEDDGSDYRKKIERGSDKFLDIRSCHHLEAAQAIYNDKVDILIDLMGYTRGGRMEIAALRPAPVQARYMGMAGTTGSDFFDYLIADQIVVPRPDTPYYSEKLVYLPDCYQVNDYQQIISKRIFTREMFGLPEDAFVLCSFNQAIKLDPIMYEAWMKILEDVPGSVLWMLAGSKVCEQHLIREAESHNIAKERIVFGGKMDKADHLARLRLADLALDTRFVNGAATTSDALWAGVPVITLKGKHFSSRMSASILMAIGMDGLVTDSLENYIKLAVRFGKNASEINCLRKKLHKNQSLKPLFNITLFTANLESGYEKIWKNYISDILPKQIKIYGE